MRERFFLVPISSGSLLAGLPLYNESVLPVPENFCDQVNKITLNFIWHNEMAKIKKKRNHTIIGERKNGALNVIDRTSMNKVHLDNGVINAMLQGYKKAIRQTGVRQEKLTQSWENLKVLTTNAIHKSFVKHIFEEPDHHKRAP